MSTLFDDTELARRHKHWIDRGTVMDNLERTLLQHQVCVLTGKRGVGKSSLAARYSQNISGERSTLWINASTRTGMLQALHTLSYHMQINQYCQGQNLLACSPSTYN